MFSEPAFKGLNLHWGPLAADVSDGSYRIIHNVAELGVGEGGEAGSGFIGRPLCLQLQSHPGQPGGPVCPRCHSPESGRSHPPDSGQGSGPCTTQPPRADCAFTWAGGTITPGTRAHSGLPNSVLKVNQSRLRQRFPLHAAGRSRFAGKLIK